MRKVFNSIFISFIRFFKKIVLRLNALDVAFTCNQNSKNNGGIFLPEARVVNLQNKPESIEIGKDTFIRGSLLVHAYGGKISIGENCYIGERTEIWSGENIKIGDNVLISHDVNIMDGNNHETDYLERANSYRRLAKFGHPVTKGSINTAAITIESYAWINFNTTILKGVTIGKGAIVAAGSIVTKDVEQFTMVGGNPARFIKQLQQNEG